MAIKFYQKCIQCKGKAFQYKEIILGGNMLTTSNVIDLKGESIYNDMEPLKCETCFSDQFIVAQPLTMGQIILEYVDN